MTTNDYFVSSEEDQIYNTPEKWYVRDKWAYYASKRKEKNQRDFIRLLTLTSIKCYDIDFFKNKNLLLTTDTGYAAESLTFCEYIPERFVLIHNRLPGARGFNRKLEDFVKAGSTDLTHRAERWFPYDVINLDFTKPGFRQKDKKTSDMMDTISKIFMIQGFKEQAFSLFLTIPAIERGNDATGIAQLKGCLNSNLGSDYPDFKHKFLEKYPNAQIPDHRELLLVVVPKLIIKYGQSRSFDVQCRERYTYINRGARTTMVTFIFDCEYIGLQNGYGGENPANILASRYQGRIIEIIEEEYQDINERFRQNARLEEKYKRFVERHN